MTTVAPLITALLGSVTVPLTVPALPIDCAKQGADRANSRPASRHATRANNCFLIFIDYSFSRVLRPRRCIKFGLEFDCQIQNWRMLRRKSALRIRNQMNRL